MTLAPPERLLLVAVGALGLGALLSALVGWAIMPGYLAAWMFVAAIPLGALPLLMFLELLGGRWAEAAGEPLRAGLRTLPLVAVLFIPVLVLQGSIYPWAGSGFEPGHAAETGWLSGPFFTGRTIGYFAIWLAIARVFDRPARDPQDRARRQRWAAGGLVLHALVGTFAAFDWTMSLEPDWRSSGYGMLIVHKQIATALAFACLLGARRVSADIRYDLGTMLLAAVIIWIYFVFMQYLVIWSANLPEEIVWYERRFGGWLVIIALAVLGHFLVPFFVLISARLKRRRHAVALVGGLVLGASFLDFFWLIVPAFRRDGFLLTIQDLLALVGVGLVWLWYFRRGARAASSTFGELRHA